MALQEYISKHIWGKLGSEQDALLMTDVAYNPLASGGFRPVLRDFSRPGPAVLKAIDPDSQHPKPFQ